MHLMASKGNFHLDIIFQGLYFQIFSLLPFLFLTSFFTFLLAMVEAGEFGTFSSYHYLFLSSFYSKYYARLLIILRFDALFSWFNEK